MPELNNNELCDFAEKGLGPLERQIHEFNKKAAIAGLNAFIRILGTAAEPLFQVGMGERYNTNYVGGCVIWILATICACIFPICRSIMAPLCEMAHLYWLTLIFECIVFPIITGGLLTYFTFKFGTEDMILMAIYRAEGRAYHTMSRGRPRWGKSNHKVGRAITIVLLLFNLPAGIFFILSRWMISSVAAAQRAVIYSRYLDELDQKIEKEFMEGSLLGTCPTEITYLCEPLDANLNADLRKNIAAAAVGKPVKIVAKNPADRVAAQSRHEAAPINEQIIESVAQTETPRPSKKNSPVKEAANSMPVPQNVKGPLPTFFQRRYFVIAGLIGIVAVLWWTYVHFHAKPSRVTAPVQSVAVPPPSARQQYTPESFTLSQGEMDAQALSPNYAMIEEINGDLLYKISGLNKFKNQCDELLKYNSATIYQMPGANQPALTKRNQIVMESLQSLVETQNQILATFRAKMLHASTLSPAELQKIKMQLQAIDGQLTAVQQGIIYDLKNVVPQNSKR